jgi:predicted RNase H-like nuclease (RuvC/YqgF family)
MALEKIEALQKKLEEEQRRREAVEKELARLSELTKSAQ